MKLLVLAGLPGTGKSALARELALLLDCPVLDKDRLRAERFGASVDYSREQDDAVVRELLAQAAALARADARASAVLDGRCWTRRSAVEEIEGWARAERVELVWIECRCPRELAHERLARDAAGGMHPAANRDAALHDRLCREADAVPRAALVLDSSQANPRGLAERVVRELGLAATR